MAATNSTADSTINWAENQAPSSVNDSARAMMAALAKFRDDNAGALITAGTSTVYTLTTNSVYDSLAHMSGQRLNVAFHLVSGDNPTLNVDGLGAKALVLNNGGAVKTGDLIQANYDLYYNNAGSQWIVISNNNGQFPAPSGTLMLFQQTTAPTGWTKQTTHNDKALRVVSGTASSGGSTAFTTILASRTIAQANLPSYNLSLASLTGTAPVPNEAISNGASAGAFTSSPLKFSGSTTNASVTFGGTLPSGGSGTAMDFAVQYVDLIIAAKN